MGGLIKNPLFPVATFSPAATGSIERIFLRPRSYCTEHDDARLAVDELPSLVLAMLVAAKCESSSSSLAKTSTLNGDCGTGSPDHVTPTLYCPGSTTLYEHRTRRPTAFVCTLNVPASAHAYIA